MPAQPNQLLAEKAKFSSRFSVRTSSGSGVLVLALADAAVVVVVVTVKRTLGQKRLNLPESAEDAQRFILESGIRRRLFNQRTHARAQDLGRLLRGNIDDEPDIFTPHFLAAPKGTELSRPESVEVYVNESKPTLFRSLNLVANSTQLFRAAHFRFRGTQIRRNVLGAFEAC